MDVPAISASVRILELLAGEWPNSVSPGRIVTDLRLNRSTCYNILATLQRAGWVVNLGNRAGWTLGPRLLTLTEVNQGSITSVVQEEIDKLSRTLGFTVFAVERDGSGGYTVIAQAERRSGVRVTAAVGDRFTFSAPAIMHAFEAWSDPADLDRKIARYGMEQFTEFTITDREQLAAALAKVRRDGFSTSVRQFDLAQGAAAAPIFDSTGRASLVICTLAFSSDISEATAEDVGALVADTARRIMERIGGSSPAAVGNEP